METEMVPDATKAVETIIARFDELMDQRQAEIDKRFDERDTKLCETLEKQIAEANAALRAELDEREKGYSLPGAEPTGDINKDYSIVRLANAMRKGDVQKHAPLEFEMSKQLEAVEAKAMGTNVDSAGGYMVPIQQITDVIELLRANVVAFQLGAMDMPGLVGSPVPMPRQSAATTGYWIGENPASNITASQATLEQVNMTPHTLAARTEFSNMFVEMSQPAAEAFLREDFSQQLGLGLDLATLTGSGADGQPLGITNQSGIGTSALAAAPTYDALYDIIAVVENANALRGSLGWAMSPQQKTAIVKMKDNINTTNEAVNDQPLERRVLSQGPLTELLGYPYATTTQLPSTAGDANALIFGDWSQVKIGRWAGLRIAASDSAGNTFERDQIMIRATMRVDVLVRHPESFCANT